MVPESMRASLLITAIVFVICIASTISDRRATDDPDGIAGDVMRQALHWTATAAQDTDPMTRWQHLALAKAYINVARQVASDVSIERASGRNVRSLSKRVEQEMQSSVSVIHKLCHKLKPQIQLSKSSGLPGDDTVQSKRVTWA